MYMKMSNIKCAVVFGSGKLLLHGTTSFQEIVEAHKELVKSLKKFKVKGKKVENESETKP